MTTSLLFNIKKYKNVKMKNSIVMILGKQMTVVTNISKTRTKPTLKSCGWKKT